MCPAWEQNKKVAAQVHISTSIHVCPESFVASSFAVEHELCGAGACDTCCNRAGAGQEWMIDWKQVLPPCSDKRRTLKTPSKA